MEYNYGVVPNFKNATLMKVPQFLSMITKDVKQGKWNIYEGGDKKHCAKISYKGKSFTYGEHIFIKGSERELKYLEEKLKQIIRVIPRKT
jgi:hypothetical protein